MSRVGLRLTWARSLALLLSSSLATVAIGCGTEEDVAVNDDVDESDENDENASDEDDKKAEKKDAGAGKKDAGGDKQAESKPTTDAGKPSKPATGGDADGEQAAGGGTTPECEALALAKKKCAGCHDGEGSASTPMGLTSFEDFAAAAPSSGKVHEVSKTRINSTDPKKMMPPTGLTNDEKATLDKWLSEGAPAGSDATCGGSDGADGDAGEEEEVWPPPGADGCQKLLANGPTATVKKGDEPHPQFVFDAPWGNDTVQAIGFKPITDNKAVIHHWILYQNNGSAGGMLNGWAPGGEKEKKRLPEDVGIAMPSGPKSLRLDVHYNNVNGTKDETDASGVEVCWTKNLRKHSASTFMGFLGIPIIAAGETKNVIGTCNVTASEPVYLLAVSPHAHTLATHMKFDVKKKDGTMINLYDQAFSFEEQQAKYLDEPFKLETGDQVITNCTFKNTTNALVTFGEDTGNEMCFNFATYYPTGKLSCGGGGGLSQSQIEGAFGGR